MGLGNIFGGATEDLLLYGVAPVSMLALLSTLAVVSHAVTRRFAERADSWRDPLAPRKEPTSVDYRATAGTMMTPEAPRSVRWLASAGLAWSASTLLAFGVLTVLGIGLVGPCVASFLPSTAVLAAALVLRVSLALPDRGHERAIAHIDRARTALHLHHAALFLAGTALAALILLSDEYFWNSLLAPEGSRAVSVALAYGALVIAPCVVGAGLSGWMRTVTALYVPAAAS